MSARIGFRVDLEDIKPYAKFSATHSGIQRTHLQKIARLFLALAIIVGVLNYLLYRDIRIGLLWTGGVFLFGQLVLWLMRNWAIPNMSIKLYRATFANIENGIAYTAEATADTLNYASPRSEVKAPWSNAMEVFENETYVYLFVAPNQALIINRNTRQRAGSL
jgi:hypothetical protein